MRLKSKSINKNSIAIKDKNNMLVQKTLVAQIIANSYNYRLDYGYCH